MTTGPDDGDAGTLPRTTRSRCSATPETSVACCEDHDDGGICGRCDGRDAVTVRYRCENCVFERSDALEVDPFTNTDLPAS